MEMQHEDAGVIRDVSEMVTLTEQMMVDALHRSACWNRMRDNSLPFVGRAAYLEQHWEGLRVLDAAAEKLGLLAMQSDIASMRKQMGEVLDRAHSTAQWRDHHVTMPSMLEFRRHVNELVGSGDAVGLSAQILVRLAAVRACPAPRAQDEVTIPSVTVVRSDEHEELFAEELSAAMLMVLAHGSDVCRAYPEDQSLSSCAITAAAIRQSLSGTA